MARGCVSRWQCRIRAERRAWKLRRLRRLRQRSLRAAELAATPLAARVPLPDGLSAGQLIGKGGLALTRLQREIEQELDLRVQREASPLALSARTRRALCGGGGCLDVAALVRLRNIERLADAEARIAALITAHLRAAAAAVAAGAVAAAARAETGVRRRGCCYPTADSPRTKPAPAPSLKPSRLGPAPPTVALPHPALASNSLG